MKKLFLLALILLTLPFFSNAQDTKERATAIKNLIDSRNYIFLAQTVIPAGKAERKLATDYSMIVAPDTITFDLSYLGDASAEPMAPMGSESPLQFNSIKFEYTIKPGKKNGWVVQIKTKYAKGTQLSLVVFSSGLPH